jgi:integrase
VARVSHARLSKFFSWAIERRLIAANPCSGVWRPDAGEARDRTLSDDEVRVFWTATGHLDQPFAQALRLMLMLGQRRNEVAGMAWSELSENREMWSIPATRTKNKRHHLVPLPRQAQDLIKSIQPVGTHFVFSTNGKTPISGWSKTKKRLDLIIENLAAKENAAVAPWRLHDLRRTCASGLQRLGVPLPVTEKILNHSGGSFAGIVSVYQKHEYSAERRAALEAWAAHVAKITS